MCWVCVCVYVYIHIYTHTYVHTYIYLTQWSISHKNNEILPFATTWMDLEGVMLNEISQTRKTNTVCYHLCGI